MDRLDLPDFGGESECLGTDTKKFGRLREIEPRLNSICRRSIHRNPMNGSHQALGYGVGSRRSERCANLGNTNIAHPTIECGTVTAVAVMNEKSWRLAIPGTEFDNLLSRPRGGGIRRHVHVENLPAGVIDHEEHIQRS